MVDLMVKRTTTEVTLEDTSLKWMRFIINGFDLHHVCSIVGYHILGTTLGCPASNSGFRLENEGHLTEILFLGLHENALSTLSRVDSAFPSTFWGRYNTTFSPFFSSLSSFWKEKGDFSTKQEKMVSSLKEEFSWNPSDRFPLPNVP